MASDDADRPTPDRAAPALRFELLHPKQAEVYRRWTPTQRLKAADDAFCFARSLLRGVIAGAHPEWTPETVDREVARRILGYSR